MYRVFAFAFALVVCLSGPAQAQRAFPIQYPDAAFKTAGASPGSLTEENRNKDPNRPGMVDITKRPYNADPTGENDATQAIQDAIDDHLLDAAKKRMYVTIYFPPGIYKISDTIAWKTTGGVRDRFMTFQGAGVDHTTIRLADGSPGFRATDSGTTKYMIQMWGDDDRWTYNGGHFNSLFDMTLDTGLNNHKASGVHAVISNSGGLHNLRIKTSDSQKRGVYGVYFPRANGPGQLVNVEVDGFDYAVYEQHTSDNGFQNDMLIDGMTISNQKVAGMRFHGKVMTIRGVTSNNRVDGIILDHGSFLTILNCTFNSTNATATSSKTAIKMVGSVPSHVFARNVKATDYGTLIDNYSGPGGGGNTTADAAGGSGTKTVAEWVSSGVATLWPNNTLKKSLDLPEPEEAGLEFYQYHTNNFNKWGVVTGANDSSDDSATIQALIDAGKEVIYFPRGTYYVNNTVIVRNNVKRIDFGGSFLIASGSSNLPRFEIRNTSSDYVIAENGYRRFGSPQEAIHFLHNSGDPLVLRYIGMAYYDRTHNGPVTVLLDNCEFWERSSNDNPSPQTEFNLTAGDRLFARAFDAEANSDTTAIVNNGGDVWILGYNDESKPGANLKTLNGGRSEILGGTFDNHNDGAGTPPVFVTENAHMSASVASTNWSGASVWGITAREVRGGTTKTLAYADNGTYIVSLHDDSNNDKDWNRWFLPLYVAGEAQAASNSAPTASIDSYSLSTSTAYRVKFFGSGTDPDAGDTLSYAWNFGDGGSSSNEDPTHTYSGPGSYNVSLTVSDGNGGSDSDPQAVVVDNGPFALAAEAESSSLNGWVASTGGSGQIVTWTGSNSFSSPPSSGLSYSFTPRLTGSYKVYLKLDNKNSANADSAWVQIAGVTPSGGSNWVQFNNQSLANGLQWLAVHDASTVVQTWNLTANTNYTLNIRHREKNFSIDQVDIRLSTEAAPQ